MRWLAACFALFSSPCSPAIPPAAQHLGFRLFDEDSGLSDLAINALAQDQAGFIYAGTENGLFRYDGSRFTLLGKSLGLPEAGSITDVEADPGRTHLGAVRRPALHVAWRPGSPRSRWIWPTATTSIINSRPFGHDMLVLRNGRLLRARGECRRYHRDARRISALRRPVLPDSQARPRPACRPHDQGRASSPSMSTSGAIWLRCGETVCRVQDGAAYHDRRAGRPPARTAGPRSCATTTAPCGCAARPASRACRRARHDLR